jgi:hypothetical protein
MGGATHFGTAALRLKELFPFPRSLDFSIYYVGAWSIRLGLNPFDVSPDLLNRLSEEEGFTSTLSPHLTSPVWALLLQPMTLFPFPEAVWVWFAISLGVTCLSAALLARLAGYSGWRAAIVLIALTVTFGPVFLSLTLGQNTLFTLLAALVIGMQLSRKAGEAWAAPVAWLVAVAAKVYPAAWLAVLPVLRRWRMFALAIILVVFTTIAVGVINPYSGIHYWFRFLPHQTVQSARIAGVDDQSLAAWLTRLGRSGTYEFAGLDASERESATWTVPWEMSRSVIRVTSLALLALFALGIVVVWLRADRTLHAEGMFYMLVLFTLLCLPHMERYNHVLLLPAMAWLWYQGGRYKYVAIIAYALVGLARLTHLWAMILDWPWGPLASGFSIYAIFLLTGAIGHRIGSGGRPAYRRDSEY